MVLIRDVVQQAIGKGYLTIEEERAATTIASPALRCRRSQKIQGFTASGDDGLYQARISSVDRGNRSIAALLLINSLANHPFHNHNFSFKK